jgi:hypothetical protein
VAEGILQQLQPLYRKSIDAAYQRCRSELQRLRILWEQTAGEKYGTSKAESWAPP